MVGKGRDPGVDARDGVGEDGSLQPKGVGCLAMTWSGACDITAIFHADQQGSAGCVGKTHNLFIDFFVGDLPAVRLELYGQGLPAGDEIVQLVQTDHGLASMLITFQPRACSYGMTGSTAIRWTSSSRTMAATLGSERSGCRMTHALFSRDWSPLNSPGMFCPRNCDDSERRGRTGIDWRQSG